MFGSAGERCNTIREGSSLTHDENGGTFFCNILETQGLCQLSWLKTLFIDTFFNKSATDFVRLAGILPPRGNINIADLSCPSKGGGNFF